MLGEDEFEVKLGFFFDHNYAVIAFVSVETQG
jgi:hypothetical protein